MQRVLFINNGIVVNIVAYPDDAVPTTVNGGMVVVDPTGTVNVGDPFDMTATMQDRAIDGVDVLVFRELFRLTNAVRALQTPALPPITALQYRAFLKTLL